MYYALSNTVNASSNINQEVDYIIYKLTRLNIEVHAESNLE